MRDGRLKALALGFACYTLLAAVFALQKVAIFSARGDRAGRDAILLTFLGIYTWGALTPAIFWTSRRFPLGPERSRGNLSAHLVAMLVLVVTDMLVYTALDQFVVPGFRWGGDPPSFAQELRLLLAWGAAGEVLWYVGVTALAHALLYRGMSLERELEAARVETRLAQARVQLLKMQLQPHFLFNTLHAISALVRDEATAARRMLSRLGDLLRLTLDHDGRETVSLTEELEMLEAYLEIQLARFPDRLVVDWDVAADALAAKVPNMLLQPIVENAVRHGIGRRNGEGRIEVRARRRQGRLELQVRDNGAGLPGGTRRLKEGIGLANTRARLRELYGPDHRLDLVNAEGGGLSVRLEIPFRAPSTPGPLRRAVRLPAELEHELPQRLVFVPAHPAVWAVIPIVWVTVLVGQALFLTGPMGQAVETARLVELGSQSLAWTLFTVGILGLCTRFPLGRGDRRRHLAVHLAANVLVLGGLVALLLAVHGALGGSPPTFAGGSGIGQSAVRIALAQFPDTLIRYWMVVGIAHALAYQRLAGEREVRASQLEATLSRTRLQLLTMQVQPRFLFETLQSISAAIEIHPASAERMLARLSDLLRLMLENDERHEVSLQEELGFLEPYLSIQETRSRGRITVRRLIEPEALDARVPGLLLQSLVDQVLRRAAGGTVDLHARRRDGTLELEVCGSDAAADGGDAEADAMLAGTRLRLRQLYGRDHRLELRRGAEGDVRLALVLPYCAVSAAAPGAGPAPHAARRREAGPSRPPLSRSRRSEA